MAGELRSHSERSWPSGTSQCFIRLLKPHQPLQRTHDFALALCWLSLKFDFFFFFKYECITSWSFRQQPSKTKCMSDKKSIVDEYDTNRFYFDDWPMALNISSAFVSHGMERSLRRSYNILITTSRSSKTALSWNLFFFSASIGNMLLIVYSVYLLASIYSWSHKFNLGGFTQSFQPH